MKHNKNRIGLIVIGILCLCLCLIAFGKKDNGTGQPKDDINNPVTKETQKDNTPKIYQSENGSGVEDMTDVDWSGPESPSASQTSESKRQSAVDQGLSSEAREYAAYCAMSADEQYAYYKRFKSADDFMAWYNNAKAAYDRENPVIELKPGDVIDLGGN